MDTMPVVPAICQSCGMVFPSQFRTDNSTHITFVGCGSGPCPRCGQVGRVPDGMYNFIGDAAEVVESSAITTDQLQDLIDLVRRLATDPTVSAEHAAEAVNQQAPVLGPVLKKYLVPQSPADFYAMLAVLIALLGLLLATHEGRQTRSQTTEVIITQVINGCASNPPLPPLAPRP